MKLRMATWVASVSFMCFIVLQILNLFNFIGNEYDLLIRWVSTIGLVLTGIFVGTLIAEKKIPAKTAVVGMLLVLFGLASIPIVTVISATILNTLPLSMETKMIVTLILSMSYGLIYMGFLIWSRKKLFSRKKTDVLF